MAIDKKRTPGPWHSDDSRWPRDIVAGNPNDPGFIKSLMSVTGGTPADMRLAAAAPLLAGMVAKLLLCSDLNLEGMEPATYDLCSDASPLLPGACGIENPSDVVILNKLASVLKD